MTIRRTKIICTIGPATASYAKLLALYNAGMNVVRINMSHADHAGAAKILNWVKTLNRKVAYPIPVMLDTQGPEIRTGVIAKPRELVPGQLVKLTVKSESDASASSIFVNYRELVDIVQVGNRVTVDNGLINFEVLKKEDQALVCKVIDGGLPGSRRHVNLPGIRVNLPAITDKDRDDIAFGVANDIDFVALSFVRDVDDIHSLRALLGRKADKVRIIAKIEDQEGVRNVHQIIQAADGVMVARGDLGIETDISALPNIQRRIVHASAVQGKRCIVATHLLESMITNPIPTRAEVTDVANAIYEGADAVMLSGETSVGAYPVRCVAQLHAIAEQTERWPGLGYEKDFEAQTDKQHVTVHAVALAESLRADGIVVITRRGLMADLVTAARPAKVPIYAFTNSSQTRRRLALNRAVYAHRTAFSSDPERTLQTAFRTLRQREDLPPMAKVVVISDVLVGQNTEAIQIRFIA